MVGGIIGRMLAEAGYEGLSDASGGTVTEPERLPATNVFNLDAKGTAIVRPYGWHVIAGANVEKDFYEPGSGGAGGDLRYKNLLGDGGRNGWEAAHKVWFGGNLLTVAPNSSTTDAGYYRFHPGTKSTGVADTVQGVDPWFPTGLAYNGRAYLAARNSEDLSVEDAPQKAIGIYKCLKCENWDDQGNPSGTYEFTVNPARHIAEELTLGYMRSGYTLAQAQARVRARINWQSWVRFRDMCDATISWNDGTSTRSVARFVSNIAIAGEIREADLLDTVCALAGVTWQDDGGVIRFLLPTDEEVVAEFSPENMVLNSFEWTPIDGQVRPNTLIARFRNLDDEYLGYGYVKYSDDGRVRREKIRRPKDTRNQQYDREFPAMLYSQAQRLLRRQYEIEANNPRLAIFRTFWPGLRVLKGDFISVTHPDPGWVSQKCRVISSNLVLNGEAGINVEIQCQAVNGTLYSDDWHSVAQSAL